MENNRQAEFIVGIFMLAGLIAVTFLALNMGDVGLFNDKHYVITAKFTSASGVRKGAYVEIAGVTVGKVKNIEIDAENYLAVVELNIPETIRLPDDSIASIRTAGIIGDKFIKITPGGSDSYIGPGMEITETEPSINLEELISKYIFESEN